MPVLEAVLDLLFPPKCPFCGALLEKGDLLCPDCQETLPWLTGPAGEKEVELTAGCLSPLAYRDKVPDAVHAFKFGGRSARGRAFGALIAQCLRDRGATADLVTWPSLSPKRLRERGYDQAGLLAKAVGEALGLPVIPTLKKPRDIPAQSGLEDAGERRANVLGAYVLLPGAEVAGKTVLLIDDVVTTGSTLSECAKVLRLAGAEKVLCATLARAR